MRIYSFYDVAYYVKNEIERITDKYTEYVDFFIGELEKDKSIVNCGNIERCMLRDKGKFFVILKRHVELLPAVINKCVSTIDFEEIGTLYRIENTRDTSWIYASKLEENEGYQTEDNLRKKIKNEIEPNQIIIITGIGKSYTIVRGHNLLNSLHSVVTSNPLIMFYPGMYDGQSFRLFNISKSENYYRAFQFVGRK